MSEVFSGFNSGTEIVPTQFFTELMPAIQSLAELKLTVFIFYLLNQFEGDERYLLRSDFTEEASFMKGLSDDTDEALHLLDDALTNAVARGTLLEIHYNDEPMYFLNSPKGRSAVTRLQSGTWVPNAFMHLSEKTDLFRPTIFRLYEENIGPLTPLIADILRDCEKRYPYEWIADAVEEAVVNNARNWRYIESILKTWKENGRNGYNG